MESLKGRKEVNFLQTQAISIKDRLKHAASRTQHGGNANEKSAEAQVRVVKTDREIDRCRTANDGREKRMQARQGTQDRAKVK